jgi:hypothetical protein
MASDTPALKDLPKVNSDLKSELQQFDQGKLHHAEPVEKNVLPSKEGEHNQFKLDFFSLYQSTCQFYLRPKRSILIHFINYKRFFIPLNF